MAGRGFYVLCLAPVVACTLLVGLGLASGWATSLPDLAAALGWSGGRSAALAATVPSSRPSTARPAQTPRPTPGWTPTLQAAPSPADAWPPAAHPPTRITAPAVHLDVPVVEIDFQTAYIGGTPVTGWELPANAAGFHRGSAYPGNAGNVVLSGHNNIQGEVFRYVPDLELGDEVFLYVGDTAYRYVVSSKEIIPERDMPVDVRIANAQAIAPGGEERVTLVTCWPYTSNTHRVIVVAMPAPLE